MRRIIASAAALLLLAACDGRVSDPGPQPQPTQDALLRQSIAQWGVVPIGEMPAQDPALVALGRALFFDRILSGNRDVSCASCHQPEKALADGRSLAVGTGVARPPVPRHAPSLLNSGLGLFYFFWDGRLRRSGPENLLVAQAMLPVLNRAEMRGSGNENELARISDADPGAVWRALMKRLEEIPEYVSLFAAAYPNRPMSQLTFEDAARALATFQMDAFTRVVSPFDRYLARDDNALTPAQKAGARLFFGGARCAQCHGGPFLGGQQFANVGVPQIGPGVGKQLPLDLGRNEVEPVALYKFAFRVAPLRNVELTAPYMHNGAYATLDAVVKHYDNVPLALRSYDATQLDPSLRGQHHGDAGTVNAVLGTLDGRLRQPLNLSDAEQRSLVEFLKSLTDPSARDLSGLRPARVPSGLPVG